ncbi:MAG: response regulator transcription factor [Gammaproteobacteria bacterium]
MKNLTTIVAVDDHPLIRQAIRSLVADREDMVLVGEGSVGEHLFPLVAEHRPDVVLLDLNMPQFEARGGDGTPNIFPALPMIARLHKEYPETAVIILSQHIIPSVVHEIVGRNGAIKGYLLKNDDLSLNLPEAVDLVNKGSVFFSEEIRQELLESPEKTGKPLLTKRQIESIAVIAQMPNASYAHHAQVLGISESTLRNHLTAANKVLGVNNITAAILRCQELGIIPLNQV